jgi:hypothetical protein
MSDFTYTALIERCKSSAIDLTPELPKAPLGATNEDVIDLWEAFISDLEGLDVHHLASEDVDGWDWTIYTHYGAKIVGVTPIHELHEAEGQWLERQAGSELDENFGFYEYGSFLGAIICENMVVEAINTLIEELIDLAQTVIDNR